MSDRRESDEPVRVEVKLHDGWYVPSRTHTKILEIDREDWDSLDPDERRELVEELRDTWLQETFDLSYEVLGADDFNDVVGE